MRSFFLFLAGLLLATALQVLLVRILPPTAYLLDLLFLLALFFSMMVSPAAGMVGATVAGLLRDTLSGGPYGLHGFANTLVVVVVGKLRQRLVIQQPFQIGSLVVLAAGLQVAVLVLLRNLLVPGAQVLDPLSLALRLLVTGLVGTLGYFLGLRSLDAVARWRERRSRRLGLDTGRVP
jgi:rod shape-determining protein MreD